MSVTVGIPTTGLRPSLRCAVEAAIRSVSMLGQAAEVLVVVNGRADAPGLGRVDSPLLRVACLDRPSAAGARNYAIGQARHDIVLLCDDDVIVPEPWCAQLRAALCDRGWAAACAPVRVPVSGPVTALADYLRIFDSQPSGPGAPGNLVTANCGLRRDLLPAHVRFDESLPIGDDGDLGHQLWQAGLELGVLDDAAPVQHAVPEAIGPNISRSLGYGMATVLVADKLGSAAGVLSAYRSRHESMTSPDYRPVRRYGEFAWPEVRAAFTVYDQILAAAYVVGCLDTLGTRLDHPVIALDRDPLIAAWEQVAAGVGELTAARSAAGWHGLTPDYSRLAAGAEPAEPGERTLSLIASVCRALAEHARLLPDRISRPAQAAAGSGWAAALGRPAGVGRMQQALTELCARGGPASRADVEQLARVTRIPFRICCEILERKLAAAQLSPAASRP